MMGNKVIAAVWVVLTLAAFAVATLFVAYSTPVETTMGPVQKIFYLHLPVAINTFVACMVCFIASVGYLLSRKSVWDDLAVSSARVAVLLCSIVLITGMLWARGAWGAWWVWSPRLTFSLMLWMLYVVYLIDRSATPSRRARAGPARPARRRSTARRPAGARGPALRAGLFFRLPSRLAHPGLLCRQRLR